MVELKTQLLQNIRSCLFHLLPRGTFRGDKFYVGDVQGNKGKSTVIELTGERAGLWKDFATGEGGDIIDLWATVHGKNAKIEFPEVMLSISEWLGIKEKNNIRDLEQYLTCSWNYYDENNQVIVIVYRYDPPLEKKQFKPFDVKKQRFKEPEIRPLYNIPGILKSDKVILVEGEKCAEALIEKGITATTAMFGANAPIDKTDWTPLKGKHIIIWPDNDEAGNKYTKNAEKGEGEGESRPVELPLPVSRRTVHKPLSLYSSHYLAFLTLNLVSNDRKYLETYLSPFLEIVLLVFRDS